ncbi:MAG TPA: ABC transporter permease [Steroidobacteraceae bacterium]|nr:ABC transporter permease [Steroidobacteraceae bacterium]
MRAFRTVFLKEVIENGRDRRTVASALLLGPLGAPLLFTVLMNVTLERERRGFEAPIELAVAGGSQAPNLVAFLKSEGVEVREFRGDTDGAARAVRAHERRLVLVVPPDYGTRLRAGLPASVQLYADTSDTSAAGDRVRAESLVRRYASQIASWRLAARGLSTGLARPLIVDEVDVSTPAGRAVTLLGMLSYFIVFATLIGGLYVAIDTTAGERERGSLEPLLTLPVTRHELVLGKILATSAWMTVSLTLTVTAFAVSLRFVRLEALGMAANFGLRTALATIGVMLPFVVLGASLMTLVASFTRSYREAQSWLTALLLIPTVPIMFAALYQVPARPGLMWIPSMSQHLLISSLLKAEPLMASSVLLSAASTLAFGALLAWAAARCYRREQILG